MSAATLPAAPSGAPPAVEILERVVLQGDLSKMSAPERVRYYAQVCESLGLNPLTKPFEYLLLKGERGEDKLILYATRACTDQLRRIHGITIAITSRAQEGGVYTVTARATDAAGRTDEAIGAVAVEREQGEWRTAQSGKRFFAGNGEYSPLRGETLANQIMKCETKAKRRVTLSICGLGWLDDAEVDTVPRAARVQVDERGEIAAAPSPPPSEPRPASGLDYPTLVGRLHRELAKKDRTWLGALKWLGIQLPEGWKDPESEGEAQRLLTPLLPQEAAERLLAALEPNGKKVPPTGP